MDFVKKNWQFRDIISEDELNRMEDGIEEGITKAEQAQQTADDAQSDIDDYKNEIRSLGLGLGTVPRMSDDLNYETQTGWVATGSETLNTPPGFTHGVVRIERRLSNRVAQTYHHLGGGTSPQIRIYTRVLGDNWSDWVQILHTGNTGSIVTEDYDGGTWTPILVGSDVPGNHTYSLQRGNYHRIGTRVFINGEIRILSDGFDNNIQGNLYIAGLPFVQRDTINDSTAFAVAFRAGINMNKYVGLYLYRGENHIWITDTSWGSEVGRITHADLSPPVTISFSGHYRI